MGRQEMIRKRSTVLKINRKQEKKNQILQRHLEKSTMKYKRPLLKIEQTFDKREKAKHVDKLRTLIHQQVHIKNKFLQKYEPCFIEDQPKFEVQTEELLFNYNDLEEEYVATDETTNIWYLPSEDALCFHLDSQIQALKERKINLATHHVDSHFKESYQSFLTTSLEEMVTKDLSLKVTEAEPPTKFPTDHMDNLITACAKSALPAEKQAALMNLIDSNQIIVAGASRDDMNALAEMPLLVLRHCLASPGRDTSSSRLPRIICSTPHFLTAQLGAKTVSKMLNDPEYALVELNVGFKQKKCPTTAYPPPILFCNNHHLVYFTLDNPSLSQVTHIVLDRAHFRDDMFDVLLLYYKLVLLHKRPDLKLIILTTPMYMDIFARHFKIPSIKLSKPARKSNPVLYLETILKDTGFVPSNNHSVECGNMKVLQNNFYKDYQNQLERHVNLLRLKGTHRADLISSILNPELEGVHLGLLTSLLSLLGEETPPPGCILVFLPHDEAIGQLYQTLESSAAFLSDKCSILKYHSKLTKKPRTHEKLLQQGRTVLILTTHELDSFDHIQGVKHIVDTGHVVRQDYVSHFNIHTSEMDWVTRLVADERKTWCEKRSTTKFYRLYTSVRGSHLRGCSTSLLGRIRPDHVVYLLKRLNIQDVHGFLEHLDFKPDHRSICLSIKRFQSLLILDPTECLSPLGFSLSSLPLPPHLSRLAILGAVFSCLDPVLSIVAVLFTQQDPFDETQTKNLPSFKSKFISRGQLSDHIVWVRALAWYQKRLPRESKTSLVQLCESSGLLNESLALLHRVKGHLACRLARARYVRSERPDDADVNVNATCERLIEALVYAGLYPNVAVMRSPGKIVISKLMAVTIHPSSVYHSATECTTSQENRKFLAYSHCYGTDMGSPHEKIFIRDVSPVPSMAAILFSHDFHIPSRKPYKFSVNEKAFHFRCANEEIVNFIQNLRLTVHQILEKSIVNHRIIDWGSTSRDVQVLRCAIELFMNKDNVCKVETLEQDDLKLKKKSNRVHVKT